jgi:flagellar protein FlaI
MKKKVGQVKNKKRQTRRPKEFQKRGKTRPTKCTREAEEKVKTPRLSQLKREVPPAEKAPIQKVEVKPEAVEKVKKPGFSWFKRRAPEPEAEKPEAEVIKPEAVEKKPSVPGRLFLKLGKLFLKLNPFALVAPRREPVHRPWFGAEPLVMSFEGRPLAEYQVGLARVVVAEENGKGRYLVSEPPLTQAERKLYRAVIEDIFYSMRPEPLPTKTPEILEGAIWDAAHDLGVVDEVRASYSNLRYYLFKDGLGYGKLHVPMMDPDIEDITIVSYEQPAFVLHRRFLQYGWLESNITFASEDDLRAFIQRLAQRTGKSPSTAIPTVDSITKEGDRLALTFGDEISHPGSTLSVRKFPRSPFSLPKLISLGAISYEAAAYCWQIVEFRGSLEVLGEYGVGKTTFANALLACIPPNLKICTIEDTLEFQLPQPNWQRLHTRTGLSMVGTRFDIDLMFLVQIAMRHRPDYLCIGEVRGAEIRALVQAAAAGRCAVTTFHAVSPEKALVRMRAPPMEVSEGGLMMIWCFAQLGQLRVREGEWVRRVTKVDEVIPGERLDIKTVFAWDPKRDTWSPSSLREVVKRSYRLREGAEARGWGEKELLVELEKKAKLLRVMVKERRLGFNEFSEEMRRFYAQ